MDPGGRSERGRGGGVPVRAVHTRLVVKIFPSRSCLNAPPRYPAAMDEHYPIFKADLTGQRAMRRVRRNANTYYTKHMDHPPFVDATHAVIDAASLPPETRDKLKRALLLRDQINHYLSRLGLWNGPLTIDPADKELIEEVRKVLDAGPVEIK